MRVRSVSPHRILAMRSTRQRAVLLALVVLGVVILTFQRGAILHTDLSGTSIRDAIRGQMPQLSTPSHDAETGNATHDPRCGVDLQHLWEIKERYSLEDKFEYYKRYVRFTRKNVPRATMTRLAQPFVPDQFRTVNFAQTKEYRVHECPEPLEVDVPESPFPTTVDASDYIFGISTSYKRLVNSTTSPINEWSYWLTDGRGSSNGGKLILLLLDASDEELESVGDQLRGIGIDVDAFHSDSSVEMAVRYLNMIPTLHNHPDRRGRKWIVTCDDDTFFPNMHALTAKLSSYDPDRMLYVGTLSDDAFAIDRHGSQAFGGAGVFVSVPLAARITEKYHECRSDAKVAESNSGWGPQGDILLRKCIYEHTGVRLTNVWDLWQLDFIGDPSGFYESGFKPMSVHHYSGGWHRARPYQSAKVAHACGEDCTLMRFRTTDDFVISNGYSVAWYPDGTDEIDWDQVERTFLPMFDDRVWNFDYKMGPQRPHLHQTGKKMSWELMESSVNPDGSVLQVYTRKRDDRRWVDETGQRMSDIDGMIELVWIP